MNGKRGRKHSAFIVLLRLEKVCKIFMRIVSEKSNDNHFEVIEQWAWLCLIGNLLKLPRSFGETLQRKEHTRELTVFAKVTAQTNQEQAYSEFGQNKLWPNCEKLSPTCCQHSPQQQNPQPQQFQQPESHQSSLNNRSQSVSQFVTRPGNDRTRVQKRLYLYPTLLASSPVSRSHNQSSKWLAKATDEFTFVWHNEQVCEKSLPSYIHILCLDFP